jgi:hypothetical protein
MDIPLDVKLPPALVSVIPFAVKLPPALEKGAPVKLPPRVALETTLLPPGCKGIPLDDEELPHWVPKPP